MQYTLGTALWVGVRKRSTVLAIACRSGTAVSIAVAMQDRLKI